MAEIDPELLGIMQCPIGRAPLVQMGDWVYSTDARTRRKYPIRDGIPIMLAEEAVEVPLPEFERIMRQVGKSELNRSLPGENARG